MRIAVKILAVSIVLGAALLAGQGMAHDRHAIPVPKAAKSGTQIQSAGLAFWASLTDAQRDASYYPSKGIDAGAYWNATSSHSAPELGLRLSDLGSDQRKHLDDLLIASTSSQGYFKIRAAMQGDAVSDDHRIAIFGNPKADPFWSYSLNGPHLRYNVMVFDGHMMLMPVLYGVDDGSDGAFPLPQEFSRGYELLKALTPEQRAAAIVTSSWTGADTISAVLKALAAKPDLTNRKGISADQLLPDQRSLLWKLIVEYVSNTDFDFAADHFQKIHAGGWQKLHFMWMGPTDGTGPVLYRVTGPSIQIDFVAQGTAAGGDIHPHVLVRDPKSLHGANWLIQHLADHH